MIPILEKLAYVSDVRQILPSIVSENKVQYQKAYEMLKCNPGGFLNPED
jgi:hypothetical protein